MHVHVNIMGNTILIGNTQIAIKKLRKMCVQNNFEDIKPKQNLEPDLTFTSSLWFGVFVFGVFHVLTKMLLTLLPDTSLMKLAAKTEINFSNYI